MRYYSKKNMVNSIKESGRLIIKKEFASNEAVEQEEQTLIYLNQCSILVPQIIKRVGQTLYLSFIEGVTYEELVSDMEKENTNPDDGAEALLRLLDYLDNIYKKTGKVKHDLNFRNFIDTTNHRVAGLDFEEGLSFGSMEQEIGIVLAFFMTYEPSFSKRKYEVIQKLIPKMKKSYDKQEIVRFCRTELREMELRRHQLGLLDSASRFLALLN